MPLYGFCTENSALEAFSPGEWQKIKEVIIRWNGIFTCEPECRRSNSLLHFHARLELFFSSVFPLNLTEAVQFTQKLTFFGFDHEPPIFSPTGSVSVPENGWNSQFSISPNVITHIPHPSLHPSIHHLSALFITCLALAE